MNEIQWLYRATRFTFAQKPANMCCRIEDYPIHIEACTQRDGAVLWAVRQMGNCLAIDGQWDYEPIPSSRTPEWMTAHRFETKEDAYVSMLEATLRTAQPPAGGCASESKEPRGGVR
jgi:hypothetical protein